MHWLACGENDVPAGLDWLVPQERARVERYRFTKRRTEYLLRRCAGKRLVAASLGWRPDPTTLSRIGILNRPGGAPYAEVDGVHAGVDLSLTDRAGWAVSLLGEPGSMAGGTIGVDLEIVEPRSRAFVTDYFTPTEQAYVARQEAEAGSEGHAVAANAIWSAKEAALKVLRVGLRADTRSVEIRLGHEVRTDGWARLEASASVPGLGSMLMPGWWRRDGSYLLTLAFRTLTEPPALIAGSGNLAHAVPSHSWMNQPRVPGT